MKLPAGFGELDFTDWLRGLISAFISGGASAVGTAFIAPALTKDLAVGTTKFFVMVSSMFVMSGTLSMFNFLRTKPIPDVKTVTTTVQTTEIQAKPPATVVTTVEETHVEPVGGVSEK